LNSSGTINITPTPAFDNVIISGVPTNDKHAATVQYVHDKIQGLDIKESVKVASTENINLADSVSSMDNEVLQNGNRILLKNQTDSKENGIYTVNASGILERAADFAVNADVGGAFVFVEKGNHGAKGFVQTTSHAIVGTDNITFTQFNGAYAFTAGDGLTQNGNTLNVDSSLNFVTEMTGLTTIGTDGSTLAIESIIDGPTIVRIDASLNDLNTTIINLSSSSSTNNGHWQTLSQELDDLSGVVVDLSSNLSAETARATAAEGTLTINLIDLSGAVDVLSGITSEQAAAIAANTAKVGITEAQAAAIAANTAKVGITTEQADAIVANTAKVGITTEQADAIVANTAKVGITTEQAAAIAIIAELPTSMDGLSPGTIWNDNGTLKVVA
jgi:hypothetical protein